MLIEIIWAWAKLKNNIFKIDQQLLSKLFIASQQTFTCYNVLLLTLEHNTHRFIVFLLLTLNKKLFTSIVSSDYDAVSIQCIKKL